MIIEGGLFLAKFILAFPTYQEKEIDGGDAILKLLCKQTGMVYSVFFAVDNRLGKQIVDSLVPGTSVSVEGHIKVDRNGKYILRAKKLIHEHINSGE